MSILWRGGEDIDFPNGTAVSVSTAVGERRTDYARCAVYRATGIAKSTVFGPITSCWLNAQASMTGSAFFSVSTGSIGLGLAGTNKGLFIGAGSSSAKIALLKYDGTTWTTLATEAGNSWAIAGVHRHNLQLVNYGATATVNVFFDGALLFTYSGDVTVSGVTQLDSVFIAGQGASVPYSEIIVADEDTRALSLFTMAATGAGTTDAWTGAYTDENEVTSNDATALYTNTAAQNEQFNLTDPPAGVFAVKQITRVARVSHTVGATATKAALGYNIGGNIHAGTSQATPAGSWGVISESLTQNPDTSAAWQLSELTALQSNAQSGA